MEWAVQLAKIYLSLQLGELWSDHHGEKTTLK
jgi:hypothetical protein